MTDPKNPEDQSDPQAGATPPEGEPTPPSLSKEAGGSSPLSGNTPGNTPASGSEVPTGRPEWGEPNETTAYPGEPGYPNQPPPYPGQAQPPYPGQGQPPYPGAGQGGYHGEYPSAGGPPQMPGQGGYQAYPPQYEPFGGEQPQRQGPQVMSIIGFVCAAVALFFCPILFGPAGIVLGVVGHTKGESLGKWAAIVSAVALIAGLLLGLAFYNSDIVPNQS